MVISDGWNIMDYIKALENLAAGNVAFATIPVLDEAGWSDDGTQSVVRVDAAQVQQWVKGLLNDQQQGKTEQLAYTPAKTPGEVANDSNINGLAAAVSQVLANGGFTPGPIGNHDGGHVTASQIQATKIDDLGAQAVAKQLGGLPVVVNASVKPDTVRVVVAADYSAAAVPDPHGRVERSSVRQLRHDQSQRGDQSECGSAGSVAAHRRVEAAD